ncbi:MAG: hypothetical protein U1E65_12300 [Myxococcota bacterium]
MRRTNLALALTLLTACGRGQLEPIGLGAGLDGGSSGLDAEDQDGGHLTKDGAIIDAAPFPDSGFPRDGGPRPDGGSRPDVGVRPDAGLHPDGGELPDGSGPQCLTEADCFNSFGLPPCPNGPGRWSCDAAGMCVPLCEMPPPPVCRIDCDCPFNLVCGPGGMCTQASGRPNFCCTNPMCRQGQRCIEPDGTPGRCGPSTPDAGVPLPDAGTTMVCHDDCDCDRNLSCANGVCLALNRANSCCDSPFCPPGNMCIDPVTRGPATCPNMPPPPDVPVGAACTAGGPECLGGFCIDENSGFPSGYCSVACQPGPMSSCPGDGVCRGTGMGQAICLDGCTDPSQCRGGYNCVQLGVAAGGRVCWPMPPTSMNPMGNPTGGSCMTDNDCLTGLTCIDEAQGFPGGYCTLAYCDPVTNPCSSGSDCYAFPGLFSLCLVECPNAGSQSTCRPGYYCLGPSGQPGVCIGN